MAGNHNINEINDSDDDSSASSGHCGDNLFPYDGKIHHFKEFSKHFKSRTFYCARDDTGNVTFSTSAQKLRAGSRALTLT